MILEMISEIISEVISEIISEITSEIALPNFCGTQLWSNVEYKSLYTLEGLPYCNKDWVRATSRHICKSHKNEMCAMNSSTYEYKIDRPAGDYSVCQMVSALGVLLDFSFFSSMSPKVKDWSTS